MHEEESNLKEASVVSAYSYFQTSRKEGKKQTQQEQENSFVVRAPGKLILFGEHSVVHAKPAIATSISLYTYARFLTVDSSHSKLAIELKDFNKSVDFSVSDLEKFAATFEEIDLYDPKPINKQFLEVDKELDKSILVVIYAYLSFAFASGKKDSLPSLKLVVQSKLPYRRWIGLFCFLQHHHCVGNVATSSK